MKIGLIDVDGHNFPNLAQMKLSAWHKAQGDRVGWYDGTHCDRVYLSKVFSDSTDGGFCYNADEVIRGGTGYALHGAGGKDYRPEEDKPLPDKIEHTMPDYSLYGIADTAYGFLTRGCPRNCAFCIVGKKEDLCSKKVADLSEFWSGQRNIVLCDPNILACKDRESLLMQLARSRAWVDFNQGLDARLLDEDVCRMIADIKVKEIHFAWDNYHDGGRILPKLEMFARHSRLVHGHNAIVYTLVNHGTTHEQDLERIYTLRKMGYWAYVMVYDKKNAPDITKKMQRWCNNRHIFAKCDNFNDYLKNT